MIYMRLSGSNGRVYPCAFVQISGAFQKSEPHQNDLSRVFRSKVARVCLLYRKQQLIQAT